MKQPAGCFQHADWPNRNGSYEDHVMASKPLASPEVLRQLLRYEPDTGRLFWKERPLLLCRSTPEWKRWNAQFCGQPALNTLAAGGYLRGAILGVHYSAHRVAWALHFGEWPKGQIDHIDRNRRNNAIENLRSVRPIDNNRNRSLPVNNTSGFVGVRESRPGRWRVTVVSDGEAIHIGVFSDIREAQIARSAAQKALGFDPSHGTRAHAQEAGL